MDSNGVKKYFYDKPFTNCHGNKLYKLDPSIYDDFISIYNLLNGIKRPKKKVHSITWRNEFGMISRELKKTHKKIILGKFTQNYRSPESKFVMRYG
jgi:hypothetical protein